MVAQQVLNKTALSFSTFSWVSWTSDDWCLPRKVHESQSELARVTSSMIALRNSIKDAGRDGIAIVTLLLMVGLLAREVNRLHFPNDVDSPDYALPVSSEESNLKVLLLPMLAKMVSNVLKKLATKPTPGATPRADDANATDTTATTATPRPSAKSTITSATDSEQPQQHSLPPPTRPKPRPRRPRAPPAPARDSSADSDGNIGDPPMRKSKRNTVLPRRYEEFEASGSRKPKSTTSTTSEDEPLAGSSKVKKGVSRGRQ